MEERVTAAEANREFSRLLRAVREGRSFTITSHGRPVARIGPPETRDQAKEAARQELVAHLRAQPALNLGRPTREEAYDE